MENWCIHLEKLCTHVYRKADTLLEKGGDFKGEDTAVDLTLSNEEAQVSMITVMVVYIMAIFTLSFGLIPCVCITGQYRCGV